MSIARYNSVPWHGLNADRPATPDPAYGVDQAWISDDTQAIYQAVISGGVLAWRQVASVAAGGGAFPKRATLWHDEATVTVGSAFAAPYVLSTQQYNLETTQSTAANGDTFTHSCVLAGGVYTFSVNGHSSTNRGKVDWYLDGVLAVSGQDWYSASPAFNVVQTASVTVSGDGYHVVQGVVNGKNGSSSDYYLSLVKYWFKQSAD